MLILEFLRCVWLMQQHAASGEAVLQNGNSEPEARLKVSFFTCKKYRRTIDSGTALNRKIMKSADLSSVLDSGFTMHA
jgi:hypothetical protein